MVATASRLRKTGPGERPLWRSPFATPVFRSAAYDLPSTSDTPTPVARPTVPCEPRRPLASLRAQDAWGNLLPSSFDSVPHGGCMYRYVGAGGIRWDPATGLYYMRARWYDPTLGRFLSLDPYVFCPSPYAYVLNSPSGLIDLTGATPGVWPGLNPGANNNNLTGIQAHNQFTVEFTQNLRQAGINPDDLRINQRVNLMDDQGNLTGNYMRPDAADPYGTVFKPVIDFKPTNPKAVSAGHRANKKMFKAIDNMHPEIPGQPRSHVVTAKRGDPAGISAAAQEACNIVKRGRGLKGVIGTLHSILGWVGLAFDIHQAWVDIQNINNGTGPSLEQPDYTGNPNGTGQPMIIFDPTTGLFEYVVDAKLPMT